MSRHHAIVEVGPGTIRRLCCGAEVAANADAALDAIDDSVALVSECPVAVESLWSAALRSLNCATDDTGNGMVVVHPSWWSSARVRRVTDAAQQLPGDALVHPRSWLLAQASDGDPEVTVVVEIAEKLVAVVGVGTVGIARNSEPHRVAQEVASAIDEMYAGTTAVVVIDAAGAVAGAPALATLIAGAVRDGDHCAVEIDAARLSRLVCSAQSMLSTGGGPPQPTAAQRAGGVRSRAATLRGLVGAAVVAAVAVPVVASVARDGVSPTTTAAVSFLVEGRVALSVPANWIVQRVLAGPGSARIQVTSPSDPEVALHVTQSPVPPGETLSVTADRLQRAIASEPDGVFVDFNPAGSSAGRPAVTYREIRASHQVRWAALLDGTVRISIGCQSGLGGEDAVREVCEEAVRSAHAIG